MPKAQSPKPNTPTVTTNPLYSAMRSSEADSLIFDDGWLRLVLSEDQYLPGYSILHAPKEVFDLHVLDSSRQARFLGFMAQAGAAILAETGARRMNYLIQGNLAPYLHVHIVPRFDWEDSPWREGPAALYPEELRIDMRATKAMPGVSERLRRALARNSAENPMPEWIDGSTLVDRTSP